ncbi:hypothetical protein NEOLEDRAFT_1133046 [Neolentinus lepideus HHB14362 ss-1]|uniref:RING-type domain-containing protein n=1 Tax=Neolentinus lepideus HHB14362 ss-1 TaxID=1314782 RepID=A0A165T0Y8_9AGAM|nr:hypothetical protein NEOLEDRAFT_1133046 [Neolentinus lepideus HHB14362 ss-1]
MLIVHPLSRCDVCLDEYSFATPQHTPHAIPCGHVFCKPCLGRLSPLMCPLCRKSFRGTEIGRLIVDRVSPDENGLIPGTPRMRFSQTEMEEIELLQRLALASGEDTPEAELSEVIVEAELWLESRNPSTNRVLRRALTSLRRSKRKEAELVNQKRAYSNLKSSYRSLRHRSEHESDMAKAVEENLLAELQNNESQNRA